MIFMALALLHSSSFIDKLNQEKDDHRGPRLMRFLVYVAVGYNIIGYPGVLLAVHHPSSRNTGIFIEFKPMCLSYSPYRKFCSFFVDALSELRRQSTSNFT